MARKRKAAIPDNIAEEYYQISQEILSSFPKYRPPVDLFQFRADIAQLYPYSRKGARLSNEQVEEIQQLCESGDLFVSRTDHPIYSEHIVKQVDLVLLDGNLKESECADIIIRAQYAVCRSVVVHLYFLWRWIQPSSTGSRVCRTAAA